MQVRPPNALPARAAPQWESIINSVETEFRSIAALDNTVQWEREAKFALQIIANSEHLQRCNTESIRAAVINVAAVGITLNPAMKLAYLVPREGLCCLDISFLGLCKIATDSGSVVAVKAVIVRQKDLPTFVNNGPYELPTHPYNPFDSDEDRGPIVGCYSVAKLHDGTYVVDFLNMDTIKKIRDKSKAKTGPWQQWEEEMIKKSTIKRGYKSWPKTERLSKAEAVLNAHEGLDDAGIIDINPAPGAGLPRSVAARREATRALGEQATAPDDSPERQALIKKLEKLITEKGQDAYEKKWNQLTGLQRRMVGKSDHERIWALGNPPANTESEGAAA